MNPKICRLLITIGLCLLVAACATQPIPDAYDPPGFFAGILHGFFVVPTFIGSIFMDIRIYAFPNSGGWYDFGYVLGLLPGVFLCVAIATGEI